MDTFCFQRVVSDDSKAQVEASLSLVLPKAHYSIGGIWNSHNCTTKNMTANPIMRILSCLITTRLDNTTTRLVVCSVVSAAFQPPDNFILKRISALKTLCFLYECGSSMLLIEKESSQCASGIFYLDQKFRS